VAVAAAEPPKEPKPLPLRNGDGLSAIASNAPVTATPLPPPEPTVEAVAADEPEQHEPAVHQSRHHYRHHATVHGKLRHNVVLASAEKTRPVQVRHAAHRRHRAAAHHQYAGRRHHQHLAASHAHAKSQRLASAIHHHNRAIRSASAAKSAQPHRHGTACGGWNGNNHPCPRSLSGPHHDGMRSASRHAAQTPSG
ncbi:MAG: hypothetical protein ACREFC_07445, partial [Stellaceae bacterium]